MDTRLERAAQLHPLQINEKTGEPYLPLPAPHSNIILTPPRLNDEDVQAIIQHLNHVEVTKWLSGPPFPYLQTHAQQWVERTYTESQRILEEIYTSAVGSLIDGCPLRIIRQVQNDGTDILLGDCGIRTWLFDEIPDLEERRKATAENESRTAGNDLKVWGFGDYIAPSHQGKGIMSLVIKTLVEQWAVPRMAVKTIKASVFTNNIASRKVFEKCGFVLWETLESWVSMPESKGGGMVGIHILKWDGHESDQTAKA